MKRIISSLIILKICSFLILSITGCGKKTPKPGEEFTKTMETAGFEVQDLTANAKEVATVMLLTTCENMKFIFMN